MLGMLSSRICSRHGSDGPPLRVRGAGEALTALRFDETGLHLAVGTQGGVVALFDLRSRRPLLIKDHMYGSKIVDIKFHTGEA